MAAHLIEALVCRSLLLTGTLLPVGPEGGEGGGRGQREEKKGQQNTLFETNSFTQLSIWKQSEGIDQASHQKILRDSTEGKNFLMVLKCRNYRVSSEMESVPWALKKIIIM